MGSSATGSGSGHTAGAHAIQLATAHSMGTVFQVMAAVMAATFVLTLLLYPRGRMTEAVPRTAAEPELELGSAPPLAG